MALSFSPQDLNLNTLLKKDDSCLKFTENLQFREAEHINKHVCCYETLNIDLQCFKEVNMKLFQFFFSLFEKEFYNGLEDIPLCIPIFFCRKMC